MRTRVENAVTLVLGALTAVLAMWVLVVRLDPEGRKQRPRGSSYLSGLQHVSAIMAGITQSKMLAPEARGSACRSASEA